MLKGVDDDGTILYQFNPDSSGFIAKGNIRWDKEGNGDIFNRAIYWDTDGFHFGSGVKLTWDNLDSEVKKNLKGLGKTVAVLYIKASSLLIPPILRTAGITAIHPTRRTMSIKIMLGM